MEKVVNLEKEREARLRAREAAAKEEVGIAFFLMSTNFINEKEIFAYGTFSPAILDMIQDRLAATGDVARQNKYLSYQSYADTIIDIGTVSVNDHESAQVYRDIRDTGGRMVEIPPRWYALKRCEVLDIEMITSPTAFSWRMRARDNQRELRTAAFDLIDIGMIRSSLEGKGEVENGSN